LNIKEVQNQLLLKERGNEMIDVENIPKSPLDKELQIVTIRYRKGNGRHNVVRLSNGGKFEDKKRNILISVPSDVGIQPVSVVSILDPKRRRTMCEVADGKEWKKADTPLTLMHGDNMRIGKYVYLFYMHKVIISPGITPSWSQRLDEGKKTLLLYPSGVPVTNEKGDYAHIWQEFSDGIESITDIDFEQEIVTPGMQIRGFIPRAIVIGINDQGLVISFDPKDWSALKDNKIFEKVP